MGEVSAVKGPPVAAAGKLRQLALGYVGSTLSNMEEKMAALKQAKAFGAVEFGAEEIGGVLGTGLWVTVQGMEIQQLNANWADGEKMSAEAQRQLDKALEAFKADFNQREACEKDRQKLAGEERLADKAKQLMEEWENNGNLYKDPSGQILDSGAAFKRAKEILLTSTSRMDVVPHMWLTANSGGSSPGSARSPHFGRVAKELTGVKVISTWEYYPQDKSYQQTYRMWGPVPIKGPTGEAPGYVVLVGQPSPLVRMTVERHFLPGVGLVREVIISALGDKIINRQELALKK